MIYDRLKEDDRQVLELDFGDSRDKLQGEYLDMYEGVKSEVLSTTMFDENSDLSIMYLGRIYMTRASKGQAEEKFSTSEQGYTVGKLLDNMEYYYYYYYYYDYYYLHCYIVLNEFYTLIWYAYLLKHFTLKILVICFLEEMCFLTMI